MDKLQELTEKLYNEGLAKGKEEGEALLQKAREEAAQIVKQAQEEADTIIAAAKKEAENYRIKVEGDVRMASQSALLTTRGAIENLLVASSADKAVNSALSEEEFIKGIITAVAKNFSSQESRDLALVLPANLKSSLEPFINNELAKTVGSGVEATFTKKIGAGFKIGPKDGGYFISLTDESFRALIGEYLRPATRKILFGE